MTKGQNELGAHLMSLLVNQLANAGCNDMDQAIFAQMPPARRDQLKADFDEWDKRANPGGGLKQFSSIQDFEWAAFIRDALRGNL